MSYRISKSIGWAMDVSELYPLLLIPNDDLYESLENVLSGTASDDWVIPEDEAHSLRIFQNDLLKFEDTDTHGDPCQMFRIVDDCIDSYKTLFVFPNMDYASRWYRYDDALDYQFELYLNNASIDFIKYMDRNPYPYNNDFMNANGSMVPFFAERSNRNMDNIMPNVPNEIRWWLVKFGIMKYEDTLKFKPCIAQWWS